MDCLDLLTVKGTLKSLLQHHSSKASILQHSAFFIVHLSHPYMTTGKTVALTRWTFVGKVMSLLFNMLSRLLITFLPRNKHLLISWLQSPSPFLGYCKWYCYKIRIYMSFWRHMFCLDMYTGEELLDHIVALFVVLWGTTILVFHSDYTKLCSH